MKKIILIALLFIALACLVSSYASEPGHAGWQEPFFLVQMADPQFGMSTANLSFEKETELFEKAISQANRLKPAFVIVCGDMINKPADPQQAEELLRIANNLDKEIPLYWVAGNHDVGQQPSEETLEWYRNTFGKDWYSFNVGGCKFLVVNSTIIVSPDKVRQETEKQWAWLNDELKKTNNENRIHTIVFQHHPLFLKDPQEQDNYFNFPGELRSTYLTLYKENGVAAVFAGHYHRNSYAKDGDMEMITSGPVGKPLGQDPSGFRIVKVFRDRIEHEYYGLDAIPQTVTLREDAKTTDSHR
jgi:3',5'-cyclic AMP phosphodiesterase CpdA